MTTFTARSPMPVSAADLYAWHARPGAFERLTPPWDPVTVVAREGDFEHLRASVRVRLGGPVRTTLVAQHYDADPARGFKDRLVRGPFAQWVHDHRMTPTGPDSSDLEDHIEYRLPLGFLGRLAGGRTVRKKLGAMFAFRHAVTASDLRRHARFPGEHLSVAVTGSRGLIGSDLVPFLTAGGHRVVPLERGKNWDPAGPVDPKLLEGIDAVVHLAGEPIAEGRWTAAKKRRIRESRTGPTARLAAAAAAAGVRTFVSAGAVGFYGDRGDEELTEASPGGTGFVADVCRAWEAATAGPARVVNLRFGVVLSPKGGALAKQLPAFRAGAGAVLGNGRQWVPWVGVGDVIGAVHHALMTGSLAGPVNVVAPGVVRQREFATELGRVLRRPVFVPAPRKLLRLAFGELADEVLLASTRAVPAKLLATGFAFDRPDLGDELRHLLGKNTL